MKDDPLFNFSDVAQFDRLIRHLYALRERGGVYRVGVTRARDQRSTKQNAYYWGVVLPYAAKGFRDAWGTDRDEDGSKIDSMWAHEFFKARYLSRAKHDPSDGEVLAIVPGSSADLDTAEFADYVLNVVQFCAEYLCTEIPEPVRMIEPPPRTLDDEPPDDREVERLAGTPETLP